MKTNPSGLLKQTITTFNRFEGSVVHHSFTYLLAGVLSSGAPLLLLPILTRYLSTAEYGVVAMFQMSLVLFNVFTGLSVGGASSIKYYDKTINLPRYIGSCVQLVIICTALCLSIVYFFQSFLSDMAGLPTGWLYMAVLISGTGHILQLRMAQWQVRNESTVYGFFQISQSLLNIFLSLLLVVPLAWGSEGRLWGLSLTTLIFSALACWSLYKNELLKITLKYDYFLPILSFGVPLIPHVLGLFLLSMIDRMIIKSQLGLSEAGIYTVAIQIAMVLGLLSMAFNTAYAPWLYERLGTSSKEASVGIVMGIYRFAICVFLLAAVVGFAAPYFVPWFAGDSYSQAGAILGWLALGQAFNALYLMVANFIFYSERTGPLSIVTIVSGSAHVAFVLLMVRVSGMEGAAIANAVSMGLRFLATWFVSNHVYPMPWFQVRSFKTSP